MTPPGAPAPIALRILSDPAWLCVVRAATERFCLLIGFDAPTAQSICLAVDEALTNVIRHGYDGRPDQPIHVELSVRPSSDAAVSPLADELCIRIRDHGRQIDPSRIAPRPLQEVRAGGLGVHIIRSVMTRVEYTRRGIDGMELVMTRCVPLAGRPGSALSPDGKGVEV